MKNSLTLSFSIFKGSKGFSFGLLFLFFFGAALITMSTIIPSTITASLNAFMSDYNMSQGNIVTEPMKTEVDGLDSSIKGVDKVESQMVVDTRVRLDNDIQKQMRLYTVEDNGFRKYHFYDNADVPEGENSIWVTKYFADAAGLHAGDYLDVKFPDDYKNLKISAVVSSPESSSCCYDDTYWSEDLDFGNLFMSRKDFEDIYGISGYSNTRSFMFKDGISIEEKDEAISKASDLLGDKVISSEIYERSKAKTIFESNIASLSQACELFPYIIFIILLICSSLFLYQTIYNQKRKIGLLRALGYSSQKVIRIYILYIILIMLIAIALGILVASFFNDYVISEYESVFSIPNRITPAPIKTVVMLAIMFIFGVLACVNSSTGITKIDPSEAYSSSVTTTKPYKFKTPLFKKMKPFNKISVSKVFKKKRRLVVLSLSLSACLILTFAGLSCIHSKGASFDGTFGSRLKYDLLIYLDKESIIDEVKNLKEVETVEPSIVFTDRLYANDKDLTLQYNAINDSSTLVVPQDINGNRVYSGDGMVMEQFILDYFNLSEGDYINVNGQDVKINSIACEYVYYVQYINFETAKKMGHPDTNAAFIKLTPGASEDEVFKKVADMDGFKYMKFLDHQQLVKADNQKALDLVYYAIIFLSIIIGLIIVINMVALSLSERKFEYGTLLALGTSLYRFRSMVTWENMLQYIIAAIFAALPCYFLTDLILHSMASPQLNFPFIHIPEVYLQAYGISLIYVIVGIIYTIIKIRNINPATTLNIRE